MRVKDLNNRQKEIYNKLKVNFDGDESFQKWLSLPNKTFRNKPPLFLLLSENYDYFERFLESPSFE